MNLFSLLYKVVLIIKLLVFSCEYKQTIYYVSIDYVVKYVSYFFRYIYVF